MTTKSIQEFGVLPSNTPATNAANLQTAIDWVSPRGAALFVEPSEEPYLVDGGVILRDPRGDSPIHHRGQGPHHPHRRRVLVQAVACLDHNEQAYNKTFDPRSGQQE